MPHEVSGKIQICDGVCETTKKLTIVSCVCSCPAGASACCKHVVTVLLYLNRCISFKHKCIIDVIEY